jgi:hypothetical protein
MCKLVLQAQAAAIAKQSKAEWAIMEKQLAKIQKFKSRTLALELGAKRIGRMTRRMECF